ncbi:hypothetical protein PIB30_102314, partial [Stylosanthes scabra]|nr:hypothetical protein [Stylosanthes scabra]
MAMAKLLLPLSLCFCLLLLGVSSSAFRQQSDEENACQFQRLTAQKPDNRIDSEGGFIETWNPNTQEFRCAGAALSRCTLRRNALRRPYYSNAPQQIFVQQGSGYFGLIFPGCPGTIEEPIQASQSQKSQMEKESHQKVHRFKEGDLIAVPHGVAFWMYNDQDTDVVTLCFMQTESPHNQLDNFPRKFNLAGKQEQEFLQYQHQFSPRDHHEGEGGNIFSGFTPEFLSHAFQVDREIVQNLRGENERREQGAIVTVRGGDLRILSPEREQFEEDEERGMENGIEETLCTAR